MNRISLLLFALSGICFSAKSQRFEKTALGAKVNINETTTEIQFYSPGIVRILKYPASKIFTKRSLSVTKSPETVALKIVQKGDVLMLYSKDLKVVLNVRDGQINFNKSDGKSLLKEKMAGASFTDFNDSGTKSYTVAQSFVLEKEEPIYGLGILQNGKLSQRNQKIKMVQNNTWDFIAFFQSVKGYGLFWDNYSPTTFNDTAEETSFSSEVGDGIDYYFIYGTNADGVVSGMRKLTGQVPMFPLWTYGFHQSKERYKSQAELVSVVKKYRELGVPLDGIIQDWQYWGNNYLWNAMDFLNPEFSNPQKMIDDVHQLNAHLLISVWSSFGPATKQYRKLDSLGALFNIGTWPESGLETWPPNMDYPSGVRVYDAYNPKARAIYWDFLNKGLFSRNIDGWWMDSTEPDHLSYKPSDMDTKTYLGSFRKVRNAYPLMTVGGVYDHQRAVSSDKRVFILTRSAFAGQQRYGANTWSGDVTSSWESLRNQIPAGLNFALCGIPYWNSDIGGFFAGSYNKSWNDGSGAKNPLFQELYVRWLQFAVFTPMMRSHGADVPREIYQFGKKGEPAYDAIENAIKLRYSLLPYIYSTARKVTNDQSTFMRALMMDFSNDKKVLDINNEYLFGQSLLVAPVINAQYTPETVVNVNEETGWNRNVTKGNTIAAVNFEQIKSKKVYLPAGTMWYDFWTNKRYAGGQELTTATSLNTIPLFVKAGSIIPIGPNVQYATEQKWDNLELRVYEGANGTFMLYEDENDNYNYEKGIFATITLNWNDSSKTLTISDRNGSFPNMLTSRTFKIKLMTAGGTVQGAYRTISYTGHKISLKL
ncbi:glycoside hydrolase family 31 protein [Pedobacter duraquae]|uniref:Alpha-D-xyloside xylohydrolase n=1 Tax=Pedobacter duraquae TaxID=425511 RepID=A0A4R6IMF5_9SPHI|nr:TIM-barrel domain-containing protein [Pedobacter duraquae]TDO23350.1 alpha-D-xyloside xylohydrolase [Pedobacter duraquae]